MPEVEDVTVIFPPEWWQVMLAGFQIAMIEREQIAQGLTPIRKTEGYKAWREAFIGKGKSKVMYASQFDNAIKAGARDRDEANREDFIRMEALALWIANADIAPLFLVYPDVLTQGMQLNRARLVGQIEVEAILYDVDEEGNFDRIPAPKPRELAKAA